MNLMVKIGESYFRNRFLDFSSMVSGVCNLTLGKNGYRRHYNVDTVERVYKYANVRFQFHPLLASLIQFVPAPNKQEFARLKTKWIVKWYTFYTRTASTPSKLRPLPLVHFCTNETLSSMSCSHYQWNYWNMIKNTSVAELSLISVRHREKASEWNWRVRGIEDHHHRHHHQQQEQQHLLTARESKKDLEQHDNCPHQNRISIQWKCNFFRSDNCQVNSPQ